MTILKTCKKVPVCPMCDGHGIIKCNKCDGSGQIYQSALLDKVALDCSRCNASGNVLCPDYEPSDKD